MIVRRFRDMSFRRADVAATLKNIGQAPHIGLRVPKHNKNKRSVGKAPTEHKRPSSGSKGEQSKTGKLKVRCRMGGYLNMLRKEAATAAARKREISNLHRLSPAYVNAHAMRELTPEIVPSPLSWCSSSSSFCSLARSEISASLAIKHKSPRSEPKNRRFGLVKRTMQCRSHCLAKQLGGTWPRRENRNVSKTSTTFPSGMCDACLTQWRACFGCQEFSALSKSLGKPVSSQVPKIMACIASSRNLLSGPVSPSGPSSKTYTHLADMQLR